MAHVVVLGAGVSGHTAASFLRRWLPREHTVTVVCPKPDYNWIPSNIWVGVGRMPAEKVRFPLAPIYERSGIEFVHAAAKVLHPEGDATDPRPFVEVEDEAGRRTSIRYDWLINATGPKLNFGATKGLGPDAGVSLSVCTDSHAAHTAKVLDECVERMRRGETQRFLIGTGHGMCTCQGAALEYIVNLEFELRRRGVRDKAEITWISNEYELGDFGMGGIHLKRGGYVTHSKIFTESLFAERGLRWITRAGVEAVEPGLARYETLDGEHKEQPFDFAMLLPPFSGVGLSAVDRQGADITATMFAPNGFMKVDADYAQKPFEQWRAADWPTTYRSPTHPNHFAAGIAFAPPHPISRPMKSPAGTPIFPTPPRTGMPSAMIGKAVAHSIADAMTGKDRPLHHANMSRMGAACVASAGKSWLSGTAAAMTVYPIIPDFERYPDYGRDIDKTFGEIGLAGHWIKHILHHMFLYKARMKPGWWLIPE